MHVTDVISRHDGKIPASGAYRVRRVFLPTYGVESFTVIGPDLRPVRAIDDYLSWLTNCEKSPNTVEAYAYDLRAFWEFLGEHAINWRSVGVNELAEFAAWARRPAKNVVLLTGDEARLTPSTVNRMLTGIIGFYDLQARNGNEFARTLIDKTRSGRGSYKPMLTGIGNFKAAQRGKVVRLRDKKKLPKTLTLEQVAAIIDAQRRLRDRFLFALLASTGMRIGQALSLQHDDVVSWERKIVIRQRDDDHRRARSKSEGTIPVTGELIRLHSDYMHEEYGDVDSKHVFINLWSGQIGSQLTYRRVYRLTRATAAKVGFDFTPHQLRHTYATLAARDGVQLEVLSALLTHSSFSSTQIYTHLTAEDLRKALAERGVLAQVEDLIS